MSSACQSLLILVGWHHYIIRFLPAGYQPDTKRHVIYDEKFSISAENVHSPVALKVCNSEPISMCNSVLNSWLHHQCAFHCKHTHCFLAQRYFNQSCLSLELVSMSQSEPRQNPFDYCATSSMFDILPILSSFNGYVPMTEFLCVCVCVFGCNDA